MPRKGNETAIVRAELLPPAHTLTESAFKQLVAQAVEQKVAEALSHGSEATFQPWFQPNAVTQEIKRRQTVTEQRKWSYYFQDYGCIVCRTKKAQYGSLGFCSTCLARVRHRLVDCMRKRDAASNKGDMTFMDTVRLARQALKPALKALPPGSTAQRRTK